jgi:hypothetical protein
MIILAAVAYVPVDFKVVFIDEGKYYVLRQTSMLTDLLT